MKITENKTTVIDTVLAIVNKWKNSGDLAHEDRSDEAGQLLFALKMEQVITERQEEMLNYHMQSLIDILASLDMPLGYQPPFLKDKSVEILYYNVYNPEGQPPVIKFLWRKNEQVGIGIAKGVGDTLSFFEASGAEQVLRSVYDMVEGFKPMPKDKTES